MSAIPTTRPRFTRAYIDTIGTSFDERGFLALVPAWLLGCAIIGGATAYYMPDDFWDKSNQAVSVVVYTGILTINGLILALSWSAFARIHECIVGDDFGTYLMEKGLLIGYLVYIGYVHAAQIAAIIASAVGLIALLYSLPLLEERIAFAAILALSIYAIKQAANSVTVMHDLIWQKAIFDRNKPKPSPDKVVHIRKDMA
jgi:hypothetical protein